MKYTLNDLCDFINGGAWSDKEYVVSGIPVIKVSNLQIEGVNFNNINFLPESSREKYLRHSLETGDLVIATVGSHPNLVNSAAGRASIISESASGFLLNQNAVCIRSKDTKLLDQFFLAYLGKTSEFQHYIQQRGRGAANQMRIAIGAIKEFELELPGIEVQKRIASILSAYDDLIENNLKRIKLLEELAKRTYEEWFVKFRINGEDLVVDEETGLPVGWERKKIAVLLNKAPKSSKIPSSEICLTGSIPVVDQSRDFIAGYTNENNSLIKVDDPIIVFGDHTRIVKLVNFDFARGADGTQLLLSNNSRLNPYLFYFSLLKIDLSNFHYARHFKFLKDNEILLPTLELSDKYKSIAAPNFTLIKNLREQNALLKQSRDFLLPRLMNGIFRVVDTEESLAIAAEPIVEYNKI